jgi:hypothetical protein
VKALSSSHNIAKIIKYTACILLKAQHQSPPAGFQQASLVLFYKQPSTLKEGCWWDFGRRGAMLVVRLSTSNFLTSGVIGITRNLADHFDNQAIHGLVSFPYLLSVRRDVVSSSPLSFEPT